MTFYVTSNPSDTRSETLCGLMILASNYSFYVIDAENRLNNFKGQDQIELCQNSDTLKYKYPRSTDVILTDCNFLERKAATPIA